jgi:hypothetical protein
MSIPTIPLSYNLGLSQFQNYPDPVSSGFFSWVLSILVQIHMAIFNTKKLKNQYMYIVTEIYLWKWTSLNLSILETALWNFYFCPIYDFNIYVLLSMILLLLKFEIFLIYVTCCHCFINIDFTVQS